MFVIMNKSTILFLLLAFAWTVISAPTAHPKTRAKKGKCSHSTLPASHASLQKSAVRSHAPLRKSPSPTQHHLRPRGVKTQLCGMNIRGQSSRNCENNPGYIKDSSGKLNWVGWNALQGHAAAKECDHLIELQMTVAALENADFCKAWDKMGELWTKRDPNARSKMQQKFFDTLKLKANPFKGLFYVDPDFNAEKRAHFSNVIHNRPSQSSNNLKGYFNAHNLGVASSIVLDIDKEAVSLLEAIFDMASPPCYDPTSPQTTQEDIAYDGALQVAQSLFKGEKKPVSAMWEKVKASI